MEKRKCEEQFDLTIICRFHVDLYEDAACSFDIRHVVPNVGSGFTGCANRVRRASNNEIDDEAAGEPIGRTTSSEPGGHPRDFAVPSIFSRTIDIPFYIYK